MAPMQTRRAAALEEQQKLKNALHELKTQKLLNEQLLKEQEDSEVDLRDIINKNSQLKAELADLNSTHTVVLEECEQLRLAVSSFSQCIETYDEALGKIKMLEGELSRSQRMVADLQSQIQSYDVKQTHNLYNELLASPSPPVLTIDLTCDSPCTNYKETQVQPIYLNSHKKIKKYIKIGKFIVKTKKLLKIRHTGAKNIALRQERSKLLNKLNTYCSSFQVIRKQYESEVHSLNKEILNLQCSLNVITAQYELSQKQMGEHILVADELLAIGNYNIDRFDSLVNKCQCSSNAKLPIAAPAVGQSADNKNINKKSCGNNDSFVHPPQNKTFVFSDGLGRDFGYLLGNQLNHKVLNMCYPGASYEYLIESIQVDILDKFSTVVLLIGNSQHLSKGEVLRGFEHLLSIQKKTDCKFILFSWPYSNTHTLAQNKYVHKLNMLLYNLTHSHTDYFHLFDVNNVIACKFTLTKDTMYLPHRYKRQIAKLLAYNIQHQAMFSSEIILDGTCSTINNIDIISSTTNSNFFISDTNCINTSCINLN